jgi:hypothetical protein
LIVSLASFSKVKSHFFTFLNISGFLTISVSVVGLSQDNLDVTVFSVLQAIFVNQTIGFP